MANPIKTQLRRRIDTWRAPLYKEIEQLRGQLEHTRAELANYESMSSREMRELTDRIRTELDQQGAHLEANANRMVERYEAFDAYVRAWVPESVDASRNLLESQRLAPLLTRLRRVEQLMTITSPSRVPAQNEPARNEPARNEPAKNDLVGGQTPSSQPLSELSAVDPGSKWSFAYSAFEDALRGSEETVATFQEPYVDVISEFEAPELPVVDLGCGRGELLKLLMSRGIACRGVDLNAVSVAEGRDAGLDVLVGDAVEYLQSLPAESLRAVTGMHIVEHLETDQRMELLVAAYEAVAPGGGVIFETPNPENLRVGATSFWLDPTHIRPIPPQLLSFQVMESGFDQVQIERLHPFEQPLEIPANADPDLAAVIAFVNELVNGPRDYAVIGRKNPKSLDE